MPNIRRFLDLSTAHLSVAARDRLDQRSEFASVYEGDCGYFAHCQEDPDAPGQVTADDERPTELTAIFSYAIALGCEYVLFDRDAEIDEKLPTFDEAEFGVDTERELAAQRT